MDKIKKFLRNEKVSGAIAIIAAIVMFFTPDHIDRIIELCLAAVGIKKLTLVEEKEK